MRGQGARAPSVGRGLSEGKREFTPNGVEKELRSELFSGESS
jgi:hypothetical protein